MKKLPAALVAFLASSPVFTFAAEPNDTSMPQKSAALDFSMVDANKDGFISSSEATYAGMSNNKFLVWDNNGDDQLSEQEFSKGQEENPDVGNDESSYQ